MGEKIDISSLLNVCYDKETDILTFSFTPEPMPGIAEEAGDEVWVRYDPETHRVITADVLNFSRRIESAFGSELIYTERTDTDMLESLHGLALQRGI